MRTVLSNPTIEGVTGFISNLVLESTAVKDAIEAFVLLLHEIKSHALIQEEVLRFALNSMTPRQSAFASVMADYSLALSSLYEGTSSLEQAADCLSTALACNKFSKEKTAEETLRAADMYLNINKFAKAAEMASKASLILSENNRPDLVEIHRYISACLSDNNLKLLEASRKFYLVSISNLVSKQRASYAYSRAVMSALLAGGGSKRTRQLALCAADSRIQSLEFSKTALKADMGELLTKEDTNMLKNLCQNHHNTIVAKAVLEHNIESLAQHYVTIKISTLAKHLQVTEKEAEKVLAEMACDGRVSAKINQQESYVTFVKPERAVHTDSAAVATMVRDLSNIVAQADRKTHV
eukprot:TRINITY_DN27721_c0_g1_i1.p1 TRINITY_DN27721_c0_g1~~TRINITY_DN27721_c0_g1_i1.p1  ORF type:complete len:377 (+),score=66.12 TRINITY_DN27721_c0_g1_i1:73-1131(+)